MFAAFRLAVQEARGHKDLYFAGLLSQHDIDSAMGDATALDKRPCLVAFQSGKLT